jgi:hypothetical protein
MKPETVMWLLPIMFMIHDFEEIIMMKPWSNRYTAILNDRLPKRIRQLANHTLNLSTPAFAFAVLWIFIFLVIFTAICVELNLYVLWLGILITYFIHILIHIGQRVLFHQYVPAILTSSLTGIYSIYGMWFIFSRYTVNILQLIGSTLLGILLTIPVLFLAVQIASRFDAWLARFEHPE